MTEATGNPFDLEFEVENEWKEYLHRQQLRDKILAPNTENENVRPASMQAVLSPAFSSTKSQSRPSRISQQLLCEKPVLQCATAHMHALGPHIHNTLTPPDDQEHDAYKLDTLLLGFLQPAKQMTPLLSTYIEKQQHIKLFTNGRLKSSTRPSKHTGPCKITASTPSANPPSPTARKRAEFLERNRISAYKCRQKKKGWTLELEKRAHELESSKQGHNIVIATLKSELLYLKNELLRHSDCSAAMRQGRKDHVPANLDSDLNGTLNNAMGDVERIGDESSRSPTTAKDLVIQQIVIQADDDEGGSVKNDEDNSHASTHFISDEELEALLTRQVAQDKSGKGTRWQSHFAENGEN